MSTSRLAIAAVGVTFVGSSCFLEAGFVVTGNAGLRGSAQVDERNAAASAPSNVKPARCGPVGVAGVLGLGALAGLGVRSTKRRAMRTTTLRAEGEDWKGAESWSVLTKTVPLKLDNVAVAKVLPHRYPFLLVDKVLEFEPGKRAVGVKNVSANEPQFTGHFPDRPIMPGVLMVEAMAQLGGIVCLQPPVSDGKGLFFFAGVDGVKWRRPVVPGDTLVMEMKLDKFKEKYGVAKMSGKAYVDGQIAVEVAEFTFALVKEKPAAEEKPPAEA